MAAPIKILVSQSIDGYLDLLKNELRNATIQNLASDPSTPASGQIYYNTSNNTLRYYNGSSFTTLTTGSGMTFGAVSAVTVGGSNTDGVGTDAARNDHVHGLANWGTVTAETSFGGSSGNGSAGTFSRSDHTHGTPTHNAAAHSGISISDLSAATGTYSFGAQTVQSSAVPSGNNDLTNKSYVDALSQGLDFKGSVRVATAAVGTLASSFENGDTVDGVALATGDRILIKDQASGAENGIYTVNVSGAPTRTVDADASGEISKGTLVYVEEGTANGGQQWVTTATSATPWVPGSSTSTWTMFFAVTATQAGAGLTATANVLAVGQGTGITVNADDVAVDTSVVVRKYAADIGNGALTEIPVTHSLGTRDVTVEVYDNTTPWAKVVCDVEHTSTSVVTLNFTAAPTSNQYRCVVHA